MFVEFGRGANYVSVMYRPVPNSIEQKTLLYTKVGHQSQQCKLNVNLAGNLFLYNKQYLSVLSKFLVLTCYMKLSHVPNLTELLEHLLRAKHMYDASLVSCSFLLVMRCLSIVSIIFTKH